MENLYELNIHTETENRGFQDVYYDMVLVVPIYNEEKILGERISSLYNYLKTTNIDFLMVLSVDRGSDRSVEIAESFASGKVDIALIVHELKRGRGFAVREAWNSFHGAAYSFIDADLATGLEVISGAYRRISSASCQLLTASRYCAGATVVRPKLRNAVSRVYNQLLRLMFKERINDHQCGFKMISDDLKNSLLDKTVMNSWFWDAELMVKANELGAKISEIPVNWVERKYSKTSISRLFKDLMLHGYGMARLAKDIREMRLISSDDPSDLKEGSLS